MNHKDEIMKISKCIWATSKMILELCKPQAAGHSKDNISSTHLHICRVVQRYGPVTVTKIAQQIPISTPYASTVVDELVHKGILRREINTSDRRKCAVTIAPHAKEMNYPAASGEVSPKDEIYFIVASDGVLDPQGCNNRMH
ncbi:MarR family winged helix-turn-helix transcriptional regulator [Desulfosarcina sp.]|uniref:MarR family winged helix-turn-helix transcriptional regulator n=1 Tax=Desulfosarcina sp. TaxID=2027861 RepID=UPI0029AD177A|nr:MarR family transcriptional regulator [Desulfosarcina sp.]MDX2453151.1 MarR family transcriptional regulator [Desulfosarcina sp.]MDX2490880.1 MarR family transcriptional regulator [Desulfosarcina sp.]